MRRNKLAKLTKHTELAYGWFGISFFHLRRVTELKSHANHFFLCFNQDSYGMAVKAICSSTGPSRAISVAFWKCATHAFMDSGVT